MSFIYLIVKGVVLYISSEVIIPGLAVLISPLSPTITYVSTLGVSTVMDFVRLLISVSSSRFMTYDVARLSKYIILGTAAAAAPATPVPATDAFPKISVGIYIPERSVPPISKSTTSKSVGFTVVGGSGGGDVP